MLLLTNQFHDLFEGLSVIWHKTIILCPTRGQHLSRCCRNLLIRRRLPPNSTVHRTCLALARELSLAKMEPKNPRALSIQQKFRFEILGNLRAKWIGTFRLHRLDPGHRAFGYCSCNQDTREQYWEQQFCQMERDISVLPTEMTRPLKEDRLQSWSRMFCSVPTENFWILGWMESASKKFFYTRIWEKKNGSCVEVRFLNLK